MKARDRLGRASRVPGAAFLRGRFAGRGRVQAALRMGERGWKIRQRRRDGREGRAGGARNAAFRKARSAEETARSVGRKRQGQAQSAGRAGTQSTEQDAGRKRQGQARSAGERGRAEYGAGRGGSVRESAGPGCGTAWRARSGSASLPFWLRVCGISHRARRGLQRSQMGILGRGASARRRGRRGRASKRDGFGEAGQGRFHRF